MHPALSPPAAAERRLHDHHMSEADFDRAPFTIAWEVTRACAFACVHCRADAQHRRDPHELTRDEGFRLIDQLKTFGDPILVFTGGDPMMRPAAVSAARAAVASKAAELLHRFLQRLELFDEGIHRMLGEIQLLGFL